VWLGTTPTKSISDHNKDFYDQIHRKNQAAALQSSDLPAKMPPGSTPTQAKKADGQKR